MAIFPYAKTGHGIGAARALSSTARVASVIAIIITNCSWSRGIIGILRTPIAARWWVYCGAIGPLTLIPLVPMARRHFHFAPPHGLDVVISISVGILCVTWFELLKYLGRGRTRAVPIPTGLSDGRGHVPA